MSLTIPFGTGVFAAFVFLIFELLIFPVLMYTTITLASFFVVKRATKGKLVEIKSIAYPFWNEGLFFRQPTHVLLFLARIACVAIPVYLETRFISHSNLIPVSRLFLNAYVPGAKDLDENLEHLQSERDEFMIPMEVFSRCTSMEEDGWINAKVANVTNTENGLETIQCVSGTHQLLYRTLQRLPPFVEPAVVEHEFFTDTSPRYRTKLTLQVVRDEGPFSEFPPWPGLEVDEPNWKYIQVKNVTVLDTEDIECFQWRSPLREEVVPVPGVRTHTFVCQNVTGSVFDFYLASVEGMTNESNTRILAREGNIVTKQTTASTSLIFLGSLEFWDKIVINAGNLARDFKSPPILLPNDFDRYIQRMTYSSTSNLSVEVEGNEESHSVELDDVVLVVAAVELISILLAGIALTVYSKRNWKDLPRANTVEGLSHIWAQSIAGWDVAFRKKPITLRLTRRRFGGQEQFMYDAVGVESGESKVERFV